MSDIETPFTQEQVDNINKYQLRDDRHPFTCCSPEEIKECQRINGNNEGILIAEIDGLKCPCGKYTQDWVDDYMTK